MASETDAEWESFRETIPVHECNEAETCPHGVGFYILASSPGDGQPVQTDLFLHNVAFDGVAQVLISMIDQMALSQDGDAPTMVKFSRGRERMRQLLDSTAPPPDVSMSLQDLLAEFMKSSGEDEHDE